MPFKITLILFNLLAYGGMAGLHWRYGTLRDDTTPVTLVWYGLAFAAYLLALVWVERRRDESLRFIWLGAVAFRLVLLLTTPTLSDDVYRYLWDGYVAHHGISPYAEPINSPVLDYLDAPIRSQANNRWMASPYLPAAQMIFYIVTLTGWLHPLPVQVAMIIFDLLGGVLLLKLLKLTHLPRRRILLYLWNPLAVLETAHGAHIDAWMVCLALLALWLTFSPKLGRLSNPTAAVVLALATATKILPALFLPVLFWRWRWKGTVMYAAALLVLLAPAGLRAGWGLTGPLDGRGLFGALRIYADQWNFNSGLFHWLEVDILPALGVVSAEAWAKRLVGASLLAILAAVWVRARRERSPRALLRLTTAPLVAYLLLTTTVHPWYALLLLVLLPFLAPADDEPSGRWLLLAPWLYLSLALPLSYLTYLDPNDFRELEWVRRMEWLPTLGLLALGWGILKFKLKKKPVL